MSATHTGGFAAALAPVRLVAFDLDGTALDAQARMSERTVAAVARVSALGVPALPVTGRPAAECRALARHYGLAGAMCASNGAVLLPGGAGVPSVRGFRRDDARAAVRRLRRRSPALRLGAVGTDVVALDEGFPEHLSSQWAPPGPGTVDEAVRCTPLCKLIAWHPRGLAAALADARAVGRLGRVTHSGPEFAEVSARGVDKGSGLRWLARRHGVEPERCAAIGDMPNDLPMLAAAGLGLAVANAHPDVRAAARFVLPDHEEDGVAHLLEALAAVLTSD